MRAQKITLNRIFTKFGLGSRQAANTFIRAGRVKVNGKIVRQVDSWIDLQADYITLDERPLTTTGARIYVALHKPVGYLTTRIDPAGRPTVFDLLPSFEQWLFPVGRLDLLSAGLLLFTNDGALSNWLLAPESGILKTYRVLLDRKLAAADRVQLEAGIELGRERTLPARITGAALASHLPWIEIQICEGKNRQVRRMFEAVHYRVQQLIRTQIGPLQLGTLPVGQWRHLTSAELTTLQKLCRAAP